jgi:translocation and assembly module TamB
MRRLLLWGAAALVLLLAALLGGLWWLLDSERGLAELAALAQRFGGGSVRIGSTQGRLLGEFVLSDVHYTGGDGLRVDLNRLHLRLVPRELLDHRLRLQVAEVGGLDVWLPPSQPSPPSGETRLPSSLPLDVVIDAFSLKDFALHQPAAAGVKAPAPLRIPAASLKGSWIGDTLDIASLNAELEPAGPLQASGRLRMASDHIDIAALSLKGPGEVTASGRFGLNQVASDLKLEWRELRWPLRGEEGARLAGGINGSGTFSGRLDQYRYTLATDAVLHQLALKLEARGSGNLEQVQFDALDLHTGKGSAQVQGKLAWAPVLRADLKGTIAQLDPGLFVADRAAPCGSPPLPLRGRGAADGGCAAGASLGVLNGTFDTQTTVTRGQPLIAFNAKLENSQLRGYPLSLAAQGSTDTRSVQLKQLLLQSGKGSLAASGSAAWAPALRAELSVQLAHFDPGQFAAAFKGDINGTVVTQTTQRAGKPDIGFTVDIGRSQLRGKPLSLQAAADLYGETVTLQKLLLQSGDTRLSASGQATPPFDLQGRLDSPNLAALDPELGGKAALGFTLQGPLDGPHLVTKGSAEGLRYGAYRVARLDWDADVDPAKPSHLSLQASEAQAGVLIHSAKLAADGQETWHHADLEVHAENGDVAFSVNGGYDRKKREWGGELSSGKLAPAGLPHWVLEKGAGLLLGAQRQSLEPACFAGEAGRACLRLEQNVLKQGLRLSLDIQRLLLAAFRPLLPQKYELDGELNGGGSLDYSNGDIAAVNADLHTSGIHIRAPGAPAVEIQASSFKADDSGGTLHGVLDLRLAQGAVNAEVRAAPAADFQARPLDGRIAVQVPDLGFVQSFVPQLQNVGGSAGGTLQLGGTVALPRVGGEIALRDGHAKVAQAGIEIQQLQLRLSGRGEGPLAVDGSMTSGGGSLSLSGTLDPSVAPPHADLALKGDSFQAVANADAHVWVSPDLHLASAPDGLHLSGSLLVPRAEITPQGLGNNGVAVSEDQVIVGAEPKAQADTLKITSTVDLALGDKVSFKGFGLSTRLEGAVTVSEEPQRVTTGQGELRLVEGRYQAYGQDLSIETGRLIFDGGDITRPAVDLYATRHPQADVTVGVKVRGTLDKPQLTLTSEPPMPREQQLSWLVLGRSLETSSSSDRSAVSQAALSLGLSGGDYFAQKIGKSVGLDLVSVGQGPVGGSSVAADATAIQGSQAQQSAGTSTAYTSQAAQLTLGKYLTPRLFISYGVSLFQPGQTFRLLYDIGHGFKLQTESGVASGGDLIYTFERGH